MCNNNPLWLLPHVRITKYTQSALNTGTYIIGCKDPDICIVSTAYYLYSNWLRWFSVLVLSYMKVLVVFLVPLVSVADVSCACGVYLVSHVSVVSEVP